MLKEYDSISKARKFTHSVLDELRSRLEAVLEPSAYRDKITIVTTGSFGREEASEESDLDLFIIFDADMPAEDVIAKELADIEAVVKILVPNSAGSTGTFGFEAVVSFSDMVTSIGGDADSNKNLTRRMLFLLEGAWLYGETRFRNYQVNLLERYMRSSSSNAKLPRFLLNDIIRYYRTITTDFEYKVSETGKSWGLRNIKLRFSRKILYFGGVITVAELADVPYAEKVKVAAELFEKPVLQRIARVGGEEKIADICQIYDEFLTAISDASTRDALNQVTKERRTDSQEYQTLRTLSEAFSASLSSWLQMQYPKSHPIHHQLIF